MVGMSIPSKRKGKCFKMDEQVKSLDQLKDEAVAAGYDIPVDPSSEVDTLPDVAEVEVIDYGDGE